MGVGRLPACKLVAREDKKVEEAVAQRLTAQRGQTIHGV